MTRDKLERLMNQLGVDSNSLSVEDVLAVVNEIERLEDYRYERLLERWRADQKLLLGELDDSSSGTD